jgi:hypothetical protein
MAGFTNAELLLLGVVLGMIITLVVVLTMTKLTGRDEDHK